MAHVLITGFEPFGKMDMNPSARLAAMLDGTDIQGTAVRTAVLPVDSRRLVHHLLPLLDGEPAAVVLTGVAADRAAIALERVALNVMDFREPDNGGAAPVDEPVVPGGPAAYFSTLPLRLAAAELNDGGIPAYISNSAGTYLCNQAFYLTMHHLARSGRPVPAGFVHLPALPEQQAAMGHVPGPSMSLSIMLEAVRHVASLALLMPVRQ